MIELLTHSSIRLTGEKTVYIDPYRIEEARHDADLILITHDHFDHFSPEDIEKVMSPATLLVLPERMKQKAAAIPCGGIYTVSPQEELTLCGIPIKTVPAYNRHKPFHPKKCGWVGYLVQIDGETVYIAGDTDAVPEVSAVRCDTAMVPIGGTYTMNARQAAELVNRMRPQTAIPTHYSDRAMEAEFRTAVDPAIRVEIKMQRY